MTKLSIVTINYNDAKGLERTLSSVWNEQTYSNFEHIVIDGGSTDGSVDVIKRYTDKLAYWVSEPDKGIYNAMNKGIDKAQGEYLLFLNSGDWLEKESILRIFSKNFSEDIVYGNFTLVCKNGEKKLKTFSKQIDYKLLYLDSLGHQSTLIRRELFDSELYREDFKIISDWVFFIDHIILGKCSTRYIDVNISFFNDEGISSNPKYRDMVFEERSKYTEELLESKLFPVSILNNIINYITNENYRYKGYLSYIADNDIDRFSSPWVLHHTRKCVRTLLKLKKLLGVRR
ncbi:MAG: glycosyltransferase [Bacteroidales bacterium]|nr:glycosyltransferase [Bacteroidales bacterium]